MIVNEEELISKNKIEVVAYFSLALKILIIPNILSNSKTKKIDGFSKEADESVAYLIGQLGKNDKYLNAINGTEILNRAINIITRVQENIGGRVVLVECEDEQKLLNFYQKNEFEVLPKDEDKKILQSIQEIISKRDQISSQVIKAIKEVVAIEERKSFNKDLIQLIRYL